MSNLLRCGLIAAGIVAAFAGGYFLRNGPDRSRDSSVSAHEVARPKSRPATSRSFIAAPTHKGPVIVAADRRKTDDFPPVILPPDASPGDAKKDDIDPAAFQMIKRELNIQTTVLDKSLPVPSVLAEAKKSESPPMPPIDLDIRPTSPPPITVGPGPLPPQDRPPPVAIPSNKIGEVPAPPGISLPELSSPKPTEAPAPPGISLPELSPPKPPEVPPPLPRKLLVNTRQIELDFAVTKTGLSKIKAVELWTTRDGGKTWAKTDRMESAVSPFRTKLASEGEYGFKMVFESESGQRTLEPKGGHDPDMKLELDTTPPSVSILPLNSSVVSMPAGSVSIEWKASDRNLESGEVRIEYSLDGDDWHMIGTGKHDKDEWAMCYKWKYPPTIPSHVLLRVSVRDLAGNVGIATTSKKVSIDLIAPEGKITGVRAMGSEPEKGPMPRAIADVQTLLFGTPYFIW